MQPQKISPWIDLFVHLLEAPLDPNLETLVEDIPTLEQMNKHPQWKLKNVVAQITLKLFQK